MCAPAVSAAPQVDELAAEAVRGWLARRPHLATGLGIHTLDSQLRPATSANVADDLRWLKDIEARVASVDRKSLTLEQRTDRDWLAAWAARERFVLEELEPQRTDPLQPLPVVEIGLRSIAESPGLEGCNRARLLLERLRHVPEVMRAARVMLRDPPRSAVAEAIEHAGATLELLRTWLPGLTRDCRDSGIQADLAEADTAAVRAVETYRLELREDVLPTAPGFKPLGPEGTARLLFAAELERSSPESLLARAGREIEERRARIDALAPSIAPGGGAAEALAALDRDSVPADQLRGAVGRTLDSLLARSGRRQLMSPPADRHIEVLETRVPGGERPPVRLIGPGPFEAGKPRVRLAVEVPATELAPADLERRAEELSWSALPFAVLHEAMPGRWPLASARHHATRRARQGFASPSAEEGWCAYVETLAREQRLVESNPRFDVAAERRALERLAACAAALALHLRGDEALAGRLVERALVPAVEVPAMLEQARRDPLASIAPVLGAWRIIALREACRARYGTRFRLGAFHDALLAEGPIPEPLARDRVRRALDRAFGHP